MDQVQRLLFPTESIKRPSHNAFPATRFQGSKLKLLDWIWAAIGDIAFTSALDLFGGTGAVSYLLKTKGKRVVFNDLLQSNCVTAEALIVNSAVTLAPESVRSLFEPCVGTKYDNFIERTFDGVFYTSEENRILDIVAQNIGMRQWGPERYLAYYALFQACLAKRPYNLFHRANLYMRLADVDRSFGNKATWDRSFVDHMLAVAEQANRAVFATPHEHQVLCRPAEDVTVAADLVYLDPPYISGKGLATNYLDYYHFLEGLLHYQEWPQRIDHDYKHLPFRRGENAWHRVDTFLRALARVADNHRTATLVMSYREDGLPTPSDLVSVFERAGKRVRVVTSSKYQYALSKTATKELLIIAE